MRQGEPAFAHHLHEITKAELVAQIPAHAEDDNFTVEMAPFEEFVHVRQAHHLDHSTNLPATMLRSSDSHQSPRLSPEALDRPLSVRESFDGLEASLEATLDGDAAVHESAKKRDAEIRSDVARVELENARLKATVAELMAKVDTLTFISERLRVENAGPIGPAGPMGRDGHEGRPGARGERGARGEPGKAAPTITAGTLDSDNFTATPILSDGTTGATLRLRPLFEAFADALNDADAAEEADAARASRDAVEREVRAQGR